MAIARISFSVKSLNFLSIVLALALPWQEESHKPSRQVILSTPAPRPGLNGPRNSAIGDKRYRMESLGYRMSSSLLEYGGKNGQEEQAHSSCSQHRNGDGKGRSQSPTSRKGRRARQERTARHLQTSRRPQAPTAPDHQASQKSPELSLVSRLSPVNSGLRHTPSITAMRSVTRMDGGDLPWVFCNIMEPLAIDSGRMTESSIRPATQVANSASGPEGLRIAQTNRSSGLHGGVLHGGTSSMRLGRFGSVKHPPQRLAASPTSPFASAIPEPSLRPPP